MPFKVCHERPSRYPPLIIIMAKLTQEELWNSFVFKYPCVSEGYEAAEKSKHTWEVGRPVLRLSCLPSSGESARQVS